MKTKPKIPTASEIETRKRLRTICQWFADKAKRIQPQPDGKITLEVAADIGDMMFDPADLMAIRDKPGQWCHNPYEWLWLLHRYQNGNVDRR